MLPFLLACGSPTPVDPGFDLQPLEDNTAPVPDVAGVLTTVSGEDEANDRFWAHARGRVDADPATVWEALQVLDVIVDRREVDLYSYAPDPTLGYDRAFQVDNEVDDLITVRFRLTWVHELQIGPEEAPERVLVRWDKTHGTAFIDLLSGTVELTARDDGTTDLAFVEHLRAAARDEATIEQYLEDLFADVVAWSAGEALPTF
ncbi:MAG: hypothetical protein KC656_24195 [Myxococcales bacterium]|nr:hypothetical protein [Myxococcales bacterium]MCB9694663.1 hypothetical protein [Alphaproteobacteria bacterium]